MSELALFSVAKEALAEARRTDEVKDIRDEAVRMRLYGEQAKDRTIIADAQEIISRAERRLGELIKSAKEVGQLGIGRPSRSNVSEPEGSDDENGSPPEPFSRVTLEDAGISKKLSAKSQKLAALDETAFEAAMKAARDKIISGDAVMVNPLKDVSTEGKRAKRAEREAALGAKQVALPVAKFGVILTDDEWEHEPWSDQGLGKAAANHYPVSSLDELKKRDVASLAAADSVLFMWTTVPHLAQAIELMEHRGFTYKTNCIWEKQYPGNRHGMGYWFWINHEILLVGTRGNPPAPAPGTQWHSIIRAPIGRHSEKPEIFHELIEAYFPTLPKIELNARVARPGWVRWGYEAPEAEERPQGEDLALALAYTYSGLRADTVLVDELHEIPAGSHGSDDGQSGAAAPAHHFPAAGLEGGVTAEADSAPEPAAVASAAEPLPMAEADIVIRAGYADKVPLADLAVQIGRPGNINYVKKRAQRLGISSRERQREAASAAATARHAANRERQP